MKNNLSTRTILGFLACLIVYTTNLGAEAQVIGYVDPSQVMSEYKLVQEIEKEVRSKNIEARRFAEDADVKIRNAKTPLEKENLEKSLAQQYKDKYQTIEEYKLEQSKTINDTISSAIKTVATSENVDLVLSKAAIYVGGVDLTDKVLLELNKAK